MSYEAFIAMLPPMFAAMVGSIVGIILVVTVIPYAIRKIKWLRPPCTEQRPSQEMKNEVERQLWNARANREHAERILTQSRESAACRR